MNATLTRQSTDIPGLIERIGSDPYQGSGVLTLQLDTNPERLPEKDYLIAVRNVVKQLRDAIPDDELMAFDKAARAAEEVAAGAKPGMQSLVIFAGDHPEANVAVQLPLRLHDAATWGPEPDIQPLREAADERERIAVLLFDSGQARVFAIYLGAIEELQEVESDVPSRQAKGGWYGLSQKRWDRHREHELQRHAKNAVAMLTKLLKERPYERLFIGGPPDAVAMLRHQLPRPIERRIAGTLRLEHFASNAEVLEAALLEAKKSEEQSEMALVEKLLNERDLPNVLVGLAPVLEALAERRVNRLLVTDFHGVDGFACLQCGRLTGGGGVCPTCEGELAPVADLRSAVVEQAIGQGARVEFLHGEAAAKLNEAGVSGAWTWY